MSISANRVAFAITILFLVVFGGNILADNGTTAVDASDWCGTQRVYEQKHFQKYGTAVAPGPCGEDHPCDDPVVRDTWIPDDSDPIQQVRIIIHNLALDDGSRPFSSPEHVAGQMDQLNADFAQAGIEFTYQINQVNSTAWRSLSEDEISAMKQATAIEPDRYLNVWVTIVEFSYSFGTFPWSYDALQSTGGIVMGHFHWVELPNRVFAHEVGHTLGLWHTFHGVDEVDACSECYEIPSANSSLVGDLCSDTPPTPTNSGPCTDLVGNDPCSDEPWGYTMPENYMGYAAQTCLDTFTPQQRGRLRCWSNHVLDNWVVPFKVEADALLGPAPLDVTFQAATHKSAIGWDWDFGDGGTDTGPSPTHTYAEPGQRTVGVTLATADKSYNLDFPGLVAAYADTVRIGQGRFDGTAGQVELYMRNFIPLQQAEIPFIYAGEISVRFDSVSAAGLRSESAGVGLISRVDNWKSASVLIGNASTELDAGFGPVATLYFTRLGSSSGGTVPIDTTSYPHHELEFIADAGTYVPVLVAGSITASCCSGTVGDANSDNKPEPTIGDVTVLVAHLFINGIPLDCYPEADVNQSGGPDPTPDDITIGDIGTLVDHLFLSGQDLPDCF